MITGYITVEEFQNSSYYCAYTECCGTTGTTQLQELIYCATSLVDNYLGRTLWNKQYSDKFVGRNLNSYHLAFMPVTEVINISYRKKRDDNYNYFQEFNLGTSGTITTYDLVNDRTGLIEIDRGFDNNYRYTVDYRAGYIEIPEDIKLAVKILVTQLATQIDTGNLVNTEVSYDNIKIDKTSFTIGGSRFMKNVVFKDPNDIDSLPFMVKAILRKYKYSKRLT